MIYDFNTALIPPLNQIGGKAKGLMDSTHAGFPVPEGIVLSVDFFKPWLDDIKSSAEWQAFLREGSKEKCEAIAQRISQLRFSAEQKAALEKHLSTLPGDLFSTRSSSPEEDLDGTSFAGMYETYLGVQRKDLEAFVIKTFASCFDYRVMGYKTQNHIALDNTAIAVVIQRQIHSDVSGVAFSLNPLNNAYDEVVINASFGLGEAIVSGLVTPDTYIVDKLTNQITEKKINAKNIAVQLTTSGFVEQTNNEHPTAQALNDTQIIELSHLVRQIEKFHEKHMDTEWAFEAGTLYLLQARPITTYLPLFPEMITNPGDNKELYMDFITVTQGFTDSMSDLGIDIWAKMVHIGNGLPMGKDGILWAIHGRHYMSMSHLMRVSPAMLKTFSSHDEPTKHIFAQLDQSEFTQGKTPAALKGFLWNITKHMAPMYAGSAIRGLFNGRSALKRYEDASDKVWQLLHHQLEVTDKPFTQLVDESLAGFSELIKEVGGVLIAASVAKWKIERMFKKHDEAKDLIVSLAMNLPNNPVAEMGRLMWQLAAQPEFMNTRSAEAFATNLNANKYSAQFMALYADYIQRFGCRGAKEIDIATPRMSENIEHIFNMLKNIDVSNDTESKVQKRSEAAYLKLRQIARNIGKEDKFIKLAKIYRDMIGYRDHPKYMYVVAVSLLRQKALLLGTQWVNEGRITKAEHVFNLSLAQISQAENSEASSLMPLVEKNIAARNLVSQVKDWPRILDSRGKIYHGVAEAKDGEISGESISPGIIQGRAKVLLNPYEKVVNKGEILVCKASEPSWVPVFINASGVVMEVGGPLQHGAIIAREYGLPCISSVQNATQIIKDGDMIEIDGSRGTLRIISTSSIEPSH
ncbi:Prodigiosin synthesizing transferase PigC [Vibrio stylophorae]|uniref:Prodigiosin synthesizing transferase PigC n=1 Tax=Vibrio stylophorae TaxID=659351 RepID=A0ABM8ZXZ8_9VIBR|nr:PEP/pyruvate-binding domain-containing protein [Vibrio stylophorae]CAH0535514.1 Prodigiosin synthesizing transferase PigC [Vibrio stylophorae]